MKKPQFLFFQGSTPTLAFQLPYALSANDVLYATFSQAGQTVTEYTRGGEAILSPPGGTLTVSECCPNLVKITMTQADTLLFAAGDCSMQLRVRKTNNSADTLIPVAGYVGKAQKGTVI